MTWARALSARCTSAATKPIRKRAVPISITAMASSSTAATTHDSAATRPPRLSCSPPSVPLRTLQSIRPLPWSPNRAHQFATHQHPADLRRSRPDLHQLGVAEDARHGAVGQEPGPAHRLHRLVRLLHRLLGGIEATGRRVLTGDIAPVAGL